MAALVAETRLICFLVKMAANEEAFVFDFV